MVDIQFPTAENI